jgi:xylulokinase
MKALMGIDISTTGAKAILIDEKGDVIQSATHTYPLKTPKPLWSEQDPEDWWQAIQKSIRSVIQKSVIEAKDILGIGLTGQMHGLVLLDKNNQVIRPAILWNDQRTGEECEVMVQKIGFENLIKITGNPALTGFTAPKILWVRAHEPENYQKIEHILLPKDYIRFKLTGTYAIDCADASGTSLLDITQRTWSKEILEKLDIPAEWLPNVFEGPEITAEITREGEKATGLMAGTPVVGGGGDQAAQAVGVGAVESGIVALTLGTSGVVFAPVGKPLIDPKGRLHAMCHSLPPADQQGWHLMGVMLSAGGSLRWLRESFAPSDDYDTLVNLTTDIVPGSEGLIFLPYLTGERTPYPDPFARGGFIGLTLRHSLPHLIKAVLEGVAFGLRDSMELVKKAGLGAIEQVRISGGGARSPIWRQILADVLNAELVTVNTTEGACFGAALLAGVGAGLWPSVKAACQATVATGNPTLPQAKNVERYKSFYQDYTALYPALKDRFKSLSIKSIED